MVWTLQYTWGFWEDDELLTAAANKVLRKFIASEQNFEDCLATYISKGVSLMKKTNGDSWKGIGTENNARNPLNKYKID